MKTFNFKQSGGYTYKNRSLAKAATWMILTTITGFALVYILTDELTMALSFVTVNFVLKFILYYFHERGWDSIQWGKYAHYEKTDEGY